MRGEPHIPGGTWTDLGTRISCGCGRTHHLLPVLTSHHRRYLHGGLHQLTEGLARDIVRFGGVCKTSTTVAQIMYTDDHAVAEEGWSVGDSERDPIGRNHWAGKGQGQGKVRGVVTTAGDVIECDHIIVAVNPSG